MKTFKSYQETELVEGSSDTADMYTLMVKGLKSMPGSPKQKEIIKQINVIRKRMGMPLMKEELEATRMPMEAPVVLVTEVLKSKDKSVIDAFYKENSLVGRILSTDGRSLEKHGMGGQTIAAWLNGKIAITAVSDVKSTEAILKYMKKSIPKGNFDKISYKKFFGEELQRTAYELVSEARAKVIKNKPKWEPEDSEPRLS